MSPAPSSSMSERIRERMGQLSPAERRVARLLLSGSPTMGLQSSAQLAERAGVSGPTVSRFVAELGFSGYAEYQKALREEISARVMAPVEFYSQHRESPTSSDLLASSGSALGGIVASSVRGLDPDEFARAVALLANRRHRVVALGGWFSNLVATYLAGRLREIRTGVQSLRPVLSDRVAALADLGRKDVVAVFDFRRYERDTHDFAQAAHARGASIVLFTDPWLSPVAELADALLPAQVVGPSPFESLAPTVAVAEMVVTAVAESLGEGAIGHFQQFCAIADSWIRPWPEPDGEPEPRAWLPAQRRRGPQPQGHGDTSR
jgi:DNA-binding MurR/RpiR family transcriptional regulator